MTVQAVLIAGPTASGKSGLAIEIAKQRNGVVVNADSMQVYDVLREITARPSVKEMDGIEHTLFGHVEPGTNYSVARWLEDAAGAIPKIVRDKKTPILVGGTGLYFKAALEGLSRVPEIDPEIRRAIRDASLNNLQSVFAELGQLDPDAAGKLDPNDTQRIVRALEVIKSTGLPLSHWQGMPKRQPILEADRCEKIVLSPDRALLHERIAARFRKMVEEGALEEVREILNLGLSHEMPAMRAIGVQQIADYLSGKLTLEMAVRLSIIATRQYAKRQSTWFRHQFDDSWKVFLSADAYLDL